MKTKIFSILAGLLLTASAFAQAPKAMTYQAVVRNSNNYLIQSSPVGIKVSILQGSVSGTAVYVETHTTQTNENGLLDIVIGVGAVVSGTYNDIIWADGPYFLKTEIDPLGGNFYIITSTSELLSVPYSNYAQVSGDMVNNAMNFVGAYKEITPIQVQGHVLITYLGFDKVAVSFIFEPIQDEPHSLLLYGTIVGNTITFTNDNCYALYGTGTKNQNSLNFNMTFTGGLGPYYFNLQKQ